MAGVRISDLPDHLVGEILSWLPISAVLSLRCVCKAWNALTREPSFVDLHSRRAAAAASKSARASYVYLRHDLSPAHLSYESTTGTGTRVITTTLPLFPELDCITRSRVRVCLWSHCRGLTCVCLVRGHEEAISVHNLATGEHRVLATLPADAWSSFHLGFDRRTNRYKLLRLEHTPTWDAVAAEVYTLGDAPGAWRRLPDCDIPLETRCTNWNGNPAWMRRNRSRSRALHVVWFDMAREEFLTRAGPKRGTLDADERAVQVFPGWNERALAMATFSTRSLTLHIWALTDEDVDGVWSPQWSLPLALRDAEYVVMFTEISGPLPGGNLMLTSNRGGLETIGPDGLIKEVKQPASKNRVRAPFEIVPHLDTLVSLQHLWNLGQAADAPN